MSRRHCLYAIAFSVGARDGRSRSLSGPSFGVPIIQDVTVASLLSPSVTARRLTQRLSGGPVEFETTTFATQQPTDVIVETRASMISRGTEGATRALAGSSLLSKARARPDLVRKVLAKAQAEGISTATELVRSRLNDPIALGYSGAGVVLRVGEAVKALRPGDRVATAGAGHGELQVVGGNLAVQLPHELSFEEASFGALCAIALNAMRLARVGPGSRILVVGLGLLGQLSGRLGLASGAVVAGIDPLERRRAVAEVSGVAAFDSNADGWAGAVDTTHGLGFDVVVLAAATPSSEPTRQAITSVRNQGTVVIVGDTGLDLERRSLYESEARVVVARSYGPGRYDPTYEELGVDYPYGYVRWTAGRNIGAALDLVADGRLRLSDLITHRFAFDDAQSAYDLIEDEEAEALGIILTYGEKGAVSEPVGSPMVEKTASPLSVGAIGAGRFAREVLFPATRDAGFGPWRLVASGSGAGASRAREAFGFGGLASSAEEVISDPSTSVVLVASDHASHAGYVVEALKAGRHVFCEKPLAVTEDELEEVVETWEGSSGSLLVGHNRRWSPAVEKAKAFLAVGDSPLQIVYRINAGQLPEGHWLTDRRQAGRLIGEVCHFIDTCNALIGAEPGSVTTLTSGRGELILDDDLTVMIGYAGGSQAVITYAASSAVAAGKERIEIMGRSRHVIIDDFSRIRLSGPSGSKSDKLKPADKGHRRQLAAFAEMVRGERDSRPETEAAFLTNRVVFAAVRSAAEGRMVRLDSPDS